MRGIIMETSVVKVLRAVRLVVKQKGVNEFQIKEIVKYFKQHQVDFNEATVRGTITSRCCIDAPNHDPSYKYYKRTKRGYYRLI